MSPSNRQRFDSLTGLHVLLVENHLSSACLLETVLEFHGAWVTTFPSTIGARRFLRSVTPHVLVVALPTTDECALLLHEVRADGPTPVPALALSCGMDSRRVTLDQRFQDCLLKPVDPLALCAVVERLGRVARRRDARPPAGGGSRGPAA